MAILLVLSDVVLVLHVNLDIMYYGGFSMDLGKIGMFIAKLRKELHLTQTQLGEKLGTNDKMVSKWERGICAPNILLLNDLSEILGVTTTELLRGERLEEIDKNDISVSATESIKYYTSLAKNKMLKSLIIILLLIVIVFCSIIGILFFRNNYDNCFVYSITSSSEQYFVEGFLVLAPEKDILIINSIKNIMDDSYFDVKAYSYEYSLEARDIEIYRQGNIALYEHQKDDQLLYFDDILSMINIYSMEDSNYNEIILDERFEDDDLNLQITYLDKKMKKQNKTIELKLNKIYSNNKLFYDGGTTF